VLNGRKPPTVELSGNLKFALECIAEHRGKVE
jgi:hypothetical protein